jgi:hypothetical protein
MKVESGDRGRNAERRRGAGDVARKKVGIRGGEMKKARAGE